MKKLLAIGWLGLFACGCSRSEAAPVVIAGSQLMAPPSFLTSGFLGVTPILDQAFSFSLAADGTYELEEMQLAVFYVNNVFGANSGIRFSVHEDSAGIPGAELGQFQHLAVPTTPHVVTAYPSAPIALQSGVRYWLVGNRTQSGQVNINVSDTFYGLYGPIAYRSQNNDWVSQQYGSLPAFVVLGRPVPEPATGVLLSISGLVSGYRHKRERSQGGP